jgi:hypothetical protein
LELELGDETKRDARERDVEMKSEQSDGDESQPRIDKVFIIDHHFALN